MIFGTSVSWFINEIIGSLLFMICIIHALKSERPINRMLELICYTVTAGIFENIGVWQNIYDYSTNRIMMFGKVPFAILFIEGAIVYSVMLLMERINVPVWVLPFGAGLLASVQDMTLDPSSVYDIYTFSGIAEGQWNWVQHYEGGIAGIPYFNFSGWFTMVFFYMICIMVGRHIYEKNQKTWIGYCYPVVSIFATVLLLVSPINQFLLFAVPFVEMNSKIPEMIMLCINFAVSIFVVLKFSKYDIRIDMKKDRLMFAMPVFLHIYALVSSLILGITKSVPTILVVSIIHCIYLVFVYRKLKTKKI